MMDKSIKHGLILAAFFWCASALAQTSINVNCATQDLHDALATANANSTAANLYTLNIQGTCFANAGTPGTFTITAPMTLQQDPAAATPAVLDGSALNSLSATNVLVNKAAGGVKLVGLIVQNGVGNFSDRLYAGGITNQGVIATTGVITTTGDLTIIKSTIQNNKASPTGAPGGIQNYGTISIQQSLVANNATLGGGGGFRDDGNPGSTTSISQSTFYQNSAPGGYGGAMYANSRGNTIISNSTFYKNSGDTGAIEIGSFSPPYASNVVITQSTITGNTGTLIGGIRVDSSTPVTISSSVLANNQSTSNYTFPNIYQFSSPASVSIDASSTLVTDADAAVNLVTLADNGGPTMTMKLGSGSLGINAIPIVAGACAVPTNNSTVNPTIDQRGAPRPGVGKTGCDVGAYETGSPQIKLTPSSGALDFSSVNNGSSRVMMAEVQNVGNDKLTLSYPTVSSVTPLMFSISSLSPVASLPSDFPVGAVEDFNIKFTPTASGPQQATLTIVNNGMANNNASQTPLNVILKGIGAGFVEPPVQQIQDILTLLSNDYPTTLFGEGPGKSAANRFNAFRNMIVSAGGEINIGTSAAMLEACSQLKDAAAKVDVPQNSAKNGNFFVGGTSAPTLYGLILTLRTTINCPQ